MDIEELLPKRLGSTGGATAVEHPRTETLVGDRSAWLFGERCGQVVEVGAGVGTQHQRVVPLGQCGGHGVREHRTGDHCRRRSLHEDGRQLVCGQMPVDRGHEQSGAHPGGHDDGPFDAVLHHEHDAVPGAHTARAQQVGELVGLFVELAVRQ